MLHELNLRDVDPMLHDEARRAFEQGNVLGILGLMNNHKSLAIVFDNIRPLKKRGIYEQALLEAFTAERANHHNLRTDVISFLFAQADRDKLRAAGIPLPSQGPFTLYRGIAGTAHARRMRGFSWTDSLQAACWFALRFADALPNPSVVEATVTADEVLVYHQKWGESEFICRPKTAKKHPISLKKMRELKKRHDAQIKADNDARMAKLRRHLDAERNDKGNNR